MDFATGPWMKYSQDEWESKQGKGSDGKGKVVRRSEEGWIRFKGKDEGKGIEDGKGKGKGKGIVDEGKGKVADVECKGKGKGIQEAAAA